MDQIHNVAKAYYARATAVEKEKAKNYFRSLDADCEGRVSLAEYKSLVSRHYANETLFNCLDKNGDGSLDFEEVLTLYFLDNVSGLRTCDACQIWLPGSYFSCLPCETNHPNSYDLCCSCYGGGKFEHHHPTADFLDSYSMRWFLTKNMTNNAQMTSQPADVEIATLQNRYGTNNMQEAAVEIFHNARNEWGNEEVEATSVWHRLMSWFGGQG